MANRQRQFDACVSLVRFTFVFVHVIFISPSYSYRIHYRQCFRWVFDTRVRQTEPKHRWMRRKQYCTRRITVSVVTNGMRNTFLCRLFLRQRRKYELVFGSRIATMETRQKRHRQLVGSPLAVVKWFLFLISQKKGRNWKETQKTPAFRLYFLLFYF